jgi:hypothetical protein
MTDPAPTNIACTSPPPKIMVYPHYADGQSIAVPLKVARLALFVSSSNNSPCTGRIRETHRQRAGVLQAAYDPDGRGAAVISGESGGFLNVKKGESNVKR